MKRSGIIPLVLALSLLHLGASESAATKALDASAKASKKSLATPTPQTFISDKIVNLLKPKTGKELMAAKQKPATSVSPKAPPAPSQAPARQAPAATFTSKAPKAPVPVKPGYVPPPPKQSPQVAQIRQEVQRILELNTRIKQMQGNQVAQLQRIQEQARIHQRILDQLEAGKRAKAKTVSDKDALLAQEKLRIIQEETKRNQALISGTSASSKTTPVKSDTKIIPLPQEKATPKS